MSDKKWSETVVLIDADYLDSVALDLIINFERMIDRPIPAGDLCHWLDCVALDGGLQQGDNDVQAVFLHSKTKESMENMRPGKFATELNGQAFKDNIAEFALLSFPVEEVVSPSDFYVQSLEALLESQQVKRLLLVPDMQAVGSRVQKLCAEAEGKHITLFAMQPIDTKGCTCEILGYSLMSALGIRSDELR